MTREPPEKRPSVTSATLSAQPGAHDGRGGREHLRHAGPALGAFVANHDHLAGLDFLPRQRGEHVFFRIVDPGRAAEADAFLAGDLGHRAVRRQRSPQDADVADRVDRILDRTNHVLAGREPGQVGQVLRQRLAGDRQAVAVQVAVLEQILHHGRRSAHAMQVFLHVAAAGPKIGQIGHAIAEGLEIVDRQRHADRPGHGDQVQHGVGRSAQGHDDRQRVLEGLAGEDVQRLDVLFQQMPHGRAGAKHSSRFCGCSAGVEAL